MNRPLASPPTIVGRRPLHRPGTGVKRMQVRNRNKKWKIKRQLQLKILMLNIGVIL